MRSFHHQLVRPFLNVQKEIHAALEQQFATRQAGGNFKREMKCDFLEGDFSPKVSELRRIIAGLKHQIHVFLFLFVRMKVGRGGGLPQGKNIPMRFSSHSMCLGGASLGGTLSTKPKTRFVWNRSMSFKNHVTSRRRVVHSSDPSGSTPFSRILF